jgi:RNA polymerase sigma-70 factor
MDRELFARLIKRGRIEWPELGFVTDAELIAFVRARIPDSQINESTRIEDLLLVCACAQGDNSAADAIHELYGDEIERAHKRIRPPIGVVQARHLVFTRLLKIPEGGAARISLYRGDGELQSWMRNAINRILLEAAQQSRPPPDSIEDAIIKKESPSPITALDPELQRVKANFMAGLRLCLTQTLSSMEARERALLRNAIIDALDAPSLALMYRQDSTQIRVTLAAARERLEFRLRNALGERMRISDKDHNTLRRFVSSQLDACLAKTLA